MVNVTGKFKWNPFTLEGEAPASRRFFYMSTQHNWRFYKDDAAEPTVALGIENTLTLLVNNTDIIRLRMTIEGSGGTGSIGGDLYYSLDNADWTVFGPSNTWNYANGHAAEGDTVDGLKLTDSVSAGKYYESNTSFSFGSDSWEMDFSIVPTATVLPDTTYYFKLMGAYLGHTNPQVTTWTASSSYPFPCYKWL